MNNETAGRNRLRSLVANIRARLLTMPLILRVLVGGAALIAILAILGLGLTRLLGPRERFAAFTLPYVQDFANVDIKRWFLEGGTWAIRNEALAQTSNPPAATGRATQIFIPQKIAPGTPYHLSVYVTLSKNSRVVGVNFNAQYPKLVEQLHRVTLERQEDGAMALSAGYIDTGGKFVAQVVLPLETTAHNYRLDVYVYDKTYLVQVNGQTLIDRRPLFYPNGLVGFYALGPATFDTLKLSVAEGEPPTEQFYVSDFDQQPGGAGWVPISGEWRVSGGELAQANPVAQDAAIAYEGHTFDDFVFQATFRHLAGAGAGVMFNMPSPYALAGAHTVRFSDQTDSLFWGYYDADGGFTRQGFLDVDPPGTAPHQLRIVSGNTNGTYDIFLDDQLMARGVALHTTTAIWSTAVPAGHIGLITSRSSASFALVEAFPLFGKPTATPIVRAGSKATATPRAAAATATRKPAATATPRPAAGGQGAGGDTLQPNSPTLPSASLRTSVTGRAAPLQSDFTGSIAASDWRPIGGSWRFVGGALAQQDAVGFDLSIVYVGNAFRSYTLEATLAHQSGSGGGVLFNMPYADRLNGAHMVRYSDRRPGGLFWGYYDASGKFVGQGYANADPPETAAHTFRVVCGESSYSIYLDGAALAQDVPYVAGASGGEGSFGYIGLITAQSAVTYSSVRVSAAEAAGARVQKTTAVARGHGAGTPVTIVGAAGGFTDQWVVNGQWTSDGGVFRQTVPDVADYLLSTGVSASTYTLEADIVLPDKPEVGAGFLFNMPDRDRRNGASMIRLAKGGSTIMWGVYDEAASFRGRGSAELPLSENGRYQLRVVVGGSRMDAFVNGQQVAQAVTLPRAEGWIALLAYGGPVTFENVKLTTGIGQ